MKIVNYNTKFLTNKQSKQASHYKISAFVSIFTFSTRKHMPLVDLQRICLDGLVRSSGTVVNVSTLDIKYLTVLQLYLHGQDGKKLPDW